MSQNKALLIGIERYSDPQLPVRPGTNQALRQISQRLQDMGWEIKLMLDDSQDPTVKPTLIQVLDAIKWIKSAPNSLLLISAQVQNGKFFPWDARASHLNHSTLPISAILSELDQSTGLILDASIQGDDPLFHQLKWILSANDQDQENELFSEFGPSRFLHAFLLSLDQINQNQDISSLQDWFQKRLLLEAPKSKLYTLHQQLESPFIYKDGSQSSADQRWLSNGKYRLLRLLGEGGIGQVYLAEDMLLREKRAIKLLKIPPKLSDDQKQQIRGRMLQSVRAAQKLSAYSKHIVQVFDISFDAQEEFPFMVMEFLKGETLSHRLYREALSTQLSFELSVTLSKTVGIAHEHKVIHRDLKPENVMLIEQGDDPNFIKLLDFDLVKLEVSEVKTQEGQVLGTLEYMAPEQLRGEAIDPRADVYALGAIIYECFSGKRANPGKNQRELIKLLLDQGAIPLKHHCPHLPDELCQLVDRCLSLNADFRPKTAMEVAHSLEQLRSKIDFHAKPTHHDRSDELVDDMAATIVSADQEIQPQIHEVKTAIIQDQASASNPVKTIQNNQPASIEIKSEPITPRSPTPASSTPESSKFKYVLIAVAVVIALSLFWQFNQPPKPSSNPTEQAKQSVDPKVDEPIKEYKEEAVNLSQIEASSMYQEIKYEIVGDKRIYQGGNESERLAAILIDLSFGDLEAHGKWQGPQALRDRVEAYWQDINLFQKKISAQQKQMELSQKEYEKSGKRRFEKQNLTTLGELWLTEQSAILVENGPQWLEKCGFIKVGDELIQLTMSIKGYATKKTCAFKKGLSLDDCQKAINKYSSDAQKKRERLNISFTFKQYDTILGRDDIKTQSCQL